MLNRRQFLQLSCLSTFVLWLHSKFPQLLKADDGSTPLPACLPFCLTSGNHLAGTGSSFVSNERAIFTRRETENGAVINISRRGLFTGRFDR